MILKADPSKQKQWRTHGVVLLSLPRMGNQRLSPGLRLVLLHLPPLRCVLGLDLGRPLRPRHCDLVAARPGLEDDNDVGVLCFLLISVFEVHAERG